MYLGLQLDEGREEEEEEEEEKGKTETKKRSPVMIILWEKLKMDNGLIEIEKLQRGPCPRK